MMQDRYRSRYRVPTASDRLRAQIAIEARAALFERSVPEGMSQRPAGSISASANDLYVAKRKAAAVLGHRVRPGDLPSDGSSRATDLLYIATATAIREPADADDDESRQPSSAAIARRSSRSVRHLQDAADYRWNRLNKTPVSSRGGCPLP